MKHLVTTLLILLIAVPVPLYAQETPREQLDKQPEMEFVEKLTVPLCGEPPMKCFDEANFKRYLQMRVQYKWLFNVHTSVWPAIEAELKKSVENHAMASGIHEKDALRWHGAYDELFPKYEKAVHRATKAEAHSIWGGGLPWLITAIVAGLAAGTVLGIYLESKVGAN